MSFITPPRQHRIGRRLVQMHVLVFNDNGTTGGKGTLKLDLTPDCLNTFWQRSMNLSGQAAFALTRANPKAAQIVPMVDHVEIWREFWGNAPQLMFAGKIGEPSVGTGDVIFRCIDYLALLQRSRSGYRTFYKTKLVGSEIVSPEWALAKGAASSPLAFVTTGTIEDPLGLDGVTPIKTNNKFGLTMQDRLFLFYTLAEMSMANTDNNVVFEITTDAGNPTFNFWKNKGSHKDDYVFSFPGNLAQFNYVPGYMDVINDVGSVVKKVGGGQEEYSVEDSASIATYYRLQTAMQISTLMGLDSTGTETDQMKAALAHMLKAGIRLPKLFVAVPRMNLVHPFYNWRLGDSFYTFAAKVGDDTQDEIADWLRVISVAASWSSDGERVQLYLRGAT